MKTISVPCHSCETHVHYGTRHSMKVQAGKVVLRCLTCGGGWAFDKSFVNFDAPKELVIQACNNLIVNKLAELIEPHSGMPDEEPP